jgi:hypothetical protein
MFSSPPKPKAARGKQTNDFCPPVHHVMSSYVSVFVHTVRCHLSSFTPIQQSLAAVADQVIFLSPGHGELFVGRHRLVRACWQRAVRNNACTFVPLYEGNTIGDIHSGTNRIPNINRCLKPESDSLNLAFS